MSEVTIQTRMNGPFLVSGPAKLIDHEGNAFDLGEKETFALCRCGSSNKKPFCDGSHKNCGFEAAQTANP